jgi:alpha-tubulin suppressor-like RCC1 family protein
VELCVGIGLDNPIVDPRQTICRVKAVWLLLAALAFVFGCQTTILAGTVVAWGNYDNYGIGEIVPEGLGDCAGIAAGAGFTLALKADGTVTNWGSAHSSLGTANVPAGLSNVLTIGAGHKYGVALRKDGTVFAWGDNAAGQTNVPAGLSNVVAIAAGGDHCLALKNDGSVIAWGSNTNWLGNYAGQATIPAGLSNVVAIAAGGCHSLALRNDGTVIAWGDNIYGQSNVPQTLSDVAAIACGEAHSAALRSDTTVIGWGYNTYGISTPPVGLSNVVSIAAGGWLSIALQNSGALVPWGSYDFGQLMVPPTATNVYAVSANFWHGVALTGSQSPVISTGALFVFPIPVTDGALAERTIRPIVGSSWQLCPANSGVIPLDYLWQLNGTNLPAATNATLSLGNLQLSQTGDYSLVTTNIFGFSGKATIHLVVEPLEITTQPTSQSVLGGTNAHFEVTANGVGPLHYQWFYNGLGILGATNASLTLTNVFPMQSGAYSVVVSNNYGAVVSSEAVLNVSPFQITTQPQSQAVLGGTNVSFVVDVTGSSPFNYQWQYNATNIVGATNSNLLLLANVAPSDSGTYSVVISNSYGMLTSAPAILSVAPFAISSQPLSLSTYPGATVEFSVATIGQDPFAYQWRFNGTNLVGASNSVLALANVTANQLGVYSVVISNAFGQIVSSNATLLLSQIAGWGENAQSQITTPPNLTNAVFIAAGVYHGLAMRADQTVEAWGWNGNGQTNVPVGLTNVSAVAAGWYHNLAVDNNGNVIAWGAGTVDQGIYSDFPDHGQSIIPTGLSNVVAVAGGGFHSVALRANGTVAVWGWSLVGQLNVPSGLSNVVAIAAGRAHSVALKSDGTVSAWGYGHETLVPTNLGNAVRIAAGFDHNLALKSDGTVVAWGDNSAGQATVPSNLTNVIAIAAGEYHSLALRNDGTVIAWGSNAFGQTNSVSNLTNVAMIASGRSFNLALISYGQPFVIIPPVHLTIVGGQTVYVPAITTGAKPLNYQWKVDGRDVETGTNAFLTLAGTQAVPGIYSLTISNPLGMAVSKELELTVIPLIITNQPKNETVLAGTNVTFTVAATGWTPFRYQWQFNGTNVASATNASLVVSNVQPSQAGPYSVLVSNAFGLVVSSNAQLTVTPLKIATQPQNRSTFLGGSVQFSVIATLQGPFAYQWKFNGVNLPGATNNPLVLTNVQITQAGVYSVVVDNGLGFVTSSNVTLSVSQFAAWGNNQFGQTNFVSAISNVVAIASGSDHNLALRNDGTVAAWGFNTFGQANVPPTLSEVISIAGGGDYSLALKSNGTVVAWGYNSYRLTNVPPTLNGVTALAGGYYHWLAVKTNGQVIAWGRNDYGQTNVPVGLSNVVAVAGGGYHCLALKADSTVQAWGQNAYGQTNVPGGLSNILAIAAGYYHNLALKSDGTVVAWGNNGQGQTNVPPGMSNIVSIAAGGYHSVALRNDGTVVAWGYNGYGQTSVPGTLRNVEAISAGFYHTLTLVNDGKPYIARPPISRAADAGTDITLSVAAIGSPVLTYQWQMNGTNVSGRTSALLVLTNLALSSAGSYACVVSNDLGVTTSLAATVQVLRTTPRIDGGLQFEAGGVRLQLSGLSGHGPLVIFSSTNLVDWNPVFTNPPVVGGIVLIDSSATNVPMRFYRASEQ